MTLWHVLEHLEDPGAALDRVHGWLAPGGAVVVAVPNLGSWQARSAARAGFTSTWRATAPTSPRRLGRLLVRHGFEVVAVGHPLPRVPLAMAIEALAGARRHGGTVAVLGRRVG